MTALSDAMHIDLSKEGSAVFGLEPRTIARRKQANKLEKGEAAMLFRIAEVVDKAIDAFDDRDKAVRWLQKPCRALSNKIPLHLMRDDIGRSLVEEVLGQIKFGLYS
jgi:putative toxin-antitoxin system antitoxin component (TIGR02293 family)